MSSSNKERVNKVKGKKQFHNFEFSIRKEVKNKCVTNYHH